MSRPLPEDAWGWCPAHECWFASGADCPQCRHERSQSAPDGEICPADFGDPCPDCSGEDDEGTWGLDDVVGLGPEPTEMTDGWYLDLLARAEFPGADPHSPWRD